MKPRLVTCTEDLIAAHTEARQALGYSHNETDERAGLCHGFTSKIEGFDRKWGRRSFFMSFPIDFALQAVGLRLVVMPLDEAEALTDGQSEHTTRDVTLLKRGGNVPVKQERGVCSMIRRPTLTPRNL